MCVVMNRARFGFGIEGALSMTALDFGPALAGLILGFAAGDTKKLELVTAYLEADGGTSKRALASAHDIPWPTCRLWLQQWDETKEAAIARLARFGLTEHDFTRHG